MTRSVYRCVTAWALLGTARRGEGILHLNANLSPPGNRHRPELFSMPLSPKDCFSRPMIAALLLLATSLGAYADERDREAALLIEVFTTSQYPIQKTSSLRAPNDSRERYRRYDIDRISLLEEALSEGLPNDPVRAKQLVLTRFQTMDSTLGDQLENAGKGLAQAMTYDIDRLPAVVFDGQSVVYGVTDIDEALAQYHQWRERTER